MTNGRLSLPSYLAALARGCRLETAIERKRVKTWMVGLCLSAMGAVSVVGQAAQPQAPAQFTLDPTLYAAAVVTVISALGGMVVLIINAAAASRDRRDAAEARRADAVRADHLSKLAEEAGRKTDDIIRGTEKIHELTNSTNSNLQKALEIMAEKNVGLEKLMAQMREEKRATADLNLAAAAARAPAPAQAAALIATEDTPVPVKLIPGHKVADEPIVPPGGEKKP